MTMFFELRDEHKAFQERVRTVTKREVTPLVEESERSEIFPTHLFQTLGREGLLCLRCPREYGGPGSDKVSECIFVEEMNRVCAGIGSSVMVQGGLATDPVLLAGSEELKRRYLPSAARGEKIGSFALTEPNAGSDVGGIQTTALKEGKGFLLNGTKTYITNGTICDFVTVAATTDPASRGRGITLFVVDRDSPGFSVTRKLRKLGNHSSDTGELSFHDCYVPREKEIGTGGGEGLQVLEETLKSGRVTYGARSTGIGQAALDATFSWVNRCRAQGAPLGKSQAVRFAVAEMAVLVETMRTMAYRGAWLYDQGMASMKDASVVKLFCTESVQQVVQKAVALQQRAGLVKENPVQRFLRDARLFKIPEGTSEIQHLIIARELGL
jgi:alkylation response protein AidB-like acyl-CoA dehydrogenase